MSKKLRKIDKSRQLRKFIFDKLKLRWSPDQIAKELKAASSENGALKRWW